MSRQQANNPNNLLLPAVPHSACGKHSPVMLLLPLLVKRKQTADSQRGMGTLDGGTRWARTPPWHGTETPAEWTWWGNPHRHGNTLPKTQSKSNLCWWRVTVCARCPGLMLAACYLSTAVTRQECVSQKFPIPCASLGLVGEAGQEGAVALPFSVSCLLPSTFPVMWKEHCPAHGHHHGCIQIGILSTHVPSLYHTKERPGTLVQPTNKKLPFFCRLVSVTVL